MNGADASRPKRAFGRSLADFPERTAAEERLLACVAKGDRCRFGTELPENATREISIRGAFLRFLLLGGDEDAPVHENGVVLSGAFIEGDINLYNGEAVTSITFKSCNLSGGIAGENANCENIILSECRCGPLMLSSARVAGDVSLRKSEIRGQVRFVGAEIGGQLDCRGGTIRNPIGTALYCDSVNVTGSVFLDDGFLVEGAVRFASSEVGGQLACGGGTFKNAGDVALSCNAAKIRGDVLLYDGFSAEGEVHFAGAEVGGRLNCRGGVFNCRGGVFNDPERSALYCDGIKVTGDVFLDGRFSADGQVRFPSAWIGGQLNCGAGTFRNADGKALFCDGAKVTGGVFLDKCFSAEGAVNFSGTEIGGQLNCSGGAFKRVRGAALHCGGAKVIGDVFLNKGFCAEGEVRFPGARVGGQFNCRSGTFQNAGGDALYCDGAKVTGSVFLDERFSADGRVNFSGIEIGGQLVCTGGTFKNNEGEALYCDGAKVTADVVLDERFLAEGEVRFRGAWIGGQLNCREGTFNNAGGDALYCDGAKVTGSVFLDERFSANGRVNFSGTDIGGQLVCNGGVFKNAKGEALSCDAAKVARDIFLSTGFFAEGEVRFRGAVIGGQLDCRGGHFSNKEPAQPSGEGELIVAANAVTLYGATVSGTLFLGHGASIEGSVDLRGASAGEFEDGSWPLKGGDADEPARTIWLDGFTYRRFAGTAPTDWQLRKTWLLGQPAYHVGQSFRPQPFEQLIKVLRDMGHDADARRIGWLKERLLRPVRVGKAARWARPFVWLTGWAWGLSCGYGYRSHRIFVALLILWLGCAAAYKHAARQAIFIPADAQVWTQTWQERSPAKECEANWVQCDAAKPYISFNPFIYSADVLIPVIDLKQRSVWMPTTKDLSIGLPHLGAIELPYLGTINLNFPTVHTPRWSVRALVWVENILGSLGILLYGALISGLIKRD